MAFKYSLILKGNYDELSRASEELQKLGYKHKSSCFQGDAIKLLVNNSRKEGSDVQNGEFGFYGRDTLARDYTFELSSPIERGAALAIAAIHDDKEGYVGEYVISLLKGTDREKIGKIVRRSIYSATDWVIEGFKFSHKIPSQARKLTPEEIITYFQEKRRIIGYRAIKDFPEVKAGDKFYWAAIGHCYISERNVAKAVNKEAVETESEWFEPVYEEVKRSTTISIGHVKTSVTIHKNGDVQFLSKSYNGVVKIHDIKRIINSFEPVLFLGVHPVSLVEEHRPIRIGCESEDYRFSLNELHEIIEKYNELNT